MGISTLIFDLGNVVLTNDWHHNVPEMYKEYENYFGITYEDMDRGWHAFWPYFKIGKISEDAFWKGFLESSGAKIIDVDKAKELWRKYQEPIEGMLDLLRELGKKYRLAALTNIGEEGLDYKREAFGLDSIFDFIVSSGYSDVAKPDKRIYEIILGRIGVSPEKCLFIDDKERNLRPARDLGIKTILFSDRENLVKDLDKMKIY